MSVVSMDEERVKELLKQALLELLQERKEIVYELLAEVIEDVALVNAIEEGKSTQTVRRSEVMEILKGVA